jgi:hypothetical protein
MGEVLVIFTGKNSASKGMGNAPNAECFQRKFSLNYGSWSERSRRDYAPSNLVFCGLALTLWHNDLLDM